MAVWGKKTKIKTVPEKNRGKKRLLLFLLILLFAAVFFVLEASLAPGIRAQAANAVHNQAVRIIADTVSDQVAADSRISNYQQLMHVQRDDQGRISMLTADTALINSFSSSLLSALEQNLAEMSQQKLSIPMFSAGSRLLAALGPDLPVRVKGAAMPEMELRDSFVSAGINQTKHSIYLEISTQLQVVVPFDSSTCRVDMTVLLAEGIIVGQIPRTYLNFDGGKN